MSSRFWVAIASAFLVLSVLLGGASGGGALANAILQGLAVLVIVAVAWAGRLRIPREGRLLVWTIGLFLALVLLTLIPVPLSVWQQLPYRGELADSMRALGVESGSLAVSLAPEATIWSLLSLLPPVAMFLLVTSLPADRRNVLLGTVVVVAIASISLGIFQLLGGPQSPLRLYMITNQDSPVGFFSNVNHNATLVLCALPCLASLGARFATGRGRARRSGGFVIIAASGVFLVLGVALMGSMAGYGLLLPTLVISALIYRRAVVVGASAGWRAALAVALIIVVIAMAGPISQERLSADFDRNPASRRAFATTTVDAIAVTFPVGTGLGTLANVYRRFQDPAAATREYVNHAHNDYLEIALELGLPGIVLVLMYILWLLRRSLHVWRHDMENASSARAGSVVVWIVLLHSLVDYPIRTSAIAALFALGCALLVSGRVRQQHGRGERGGGVTHIRITDEEDRPELPTGTPISGNEAAAFGAARPQGSSS